MPAAGGRQDVVGRIVAALVVAGVALCAVLAVLEWRRSEAALRAELAATGTRVASDLVRASPLLDNPHGEDAARELLRIEAESAGVRAVRIQRSNGTVVSFGDWPEGEVERIVLPAGTALAPGRVALERPTLVEEQAGDLGLQVVLDGPAAARSRRIDLLERLGVQWLVAASLTFVSVMLVRRWLGQPLADLSTLVKATPRAHALAALAESDAGDVGGLAGDVASLLRELDEGRRQIAAQQHELDELFDRSPTATLRIASDGAIRRANAAAAAALDEPAEALVARRVDDLVQAEDRATLRELVRRVEREPSARARLRLRPAVHAPTREVVVEAVGLRNGDGKVAAIQLSILQIGVRERGAERAEALRLLVDHVAEAALLASPDGQVLAANARAAALLRRELATIEGANLREAGFWDRLGIEDTAGWCARHASLPDDEVVQERIQASSGAMIVRSMPVRGSHGLGGRVWLFTAAGAEGDAEQAAAAHKRRMNALRNLGTALADVRDVDGMMQATLAEMRPMLGVEAIGIALRGGAGGKRTRQLLYRGPAPILLGPSRQLATTVERELLPIVCAQAEALHWPDTDAAATNWAGGFRAAGLTCVAASPIGTGRVVQGLIWVAQRGGEPLAHDTLDLLETLGPLVAARLEGAQVAERMQGLHLVDPVTELPTVLQFERATHGMLGQPERACALLVLDLDRFESVNRNHGRWGGDAALRAVGARIVGGVRHSAFVARFAGSAFGVLLPDTDRAAAVAIAERMRRSISALPVDLPGGATAGLTASVGVAVWPGDSLAIDEVLDLALVRLRAAKTGGRDRVVATNPAPLAHAG